MSPLLTGAPQALSCCDTPTPVTSATTKFVTLTCPVPSRPYSSTRSAWSPALPQNTGADISWTVPAWAAVTPSAEAAREAIVNNLTDLVNI